LLQQHCDIDVTIIVKQARREESENSCSLPPATIALQCLANHELL
jgi:hypothetical protein